MKIKITDMFDHTSDFAPDIPEDRTRTDRLKQKTLKKLRQADAGVPRKRRLSRPLLVAAILAAALAVCGFSYAYLQWTGFSFTDDLTPADKASIHEQASQTVSEEVDPDGNITYFDENGKELMTLTPEEDEAYRAQLRKEKEQAVQASTDKVDIDTFEWTPGGITELAVGEDGCFEDFMLGYTYAVILYPQDSDGFTLSKGDTAVINLKSDPSLILKFGYISDKKAHTCSSEQNDDFSYTIEIPEDGVYCFYVINASSEVAEFTEGIVTINRK